MSLPKRFAGEPGRSRWGAEGPDAVKTIMMATDLSERSDRDLRRATLLAWQYGAGIALVHAVDDDQPRRIVEAEREEGKKFLRRKE